MACDPTALWRVPLPAHDHAALERAFERDPDLWVDVGRAFVGLVELGVNDVFVRAFVRGVQNRGDSGAPALAVLPAASAALWELTCRR